MRKIHSEDRKNWGSDRKKNMLNGHIVQQPVYKRPHYTALALSPTMTWVMVFCASGD
jgi:hypothetical protein